MGFPHHKARGGDKEGNEGTILLDLVTCFFFPQCWKVELQEEKMLKEIFDQYLQIYLTDAIKTENEGSRFWKE